MYEIIYRTYVLLLGITIRTLAQIFTDAGADSGGVHPKITDAGALQIAPFPLGGRLAKMVASL
jgi:hypothetical protein